MGKVHAVVGVASELEKILGLSLRLPFFNVLRTAGAVIRGIRVFLNVYTAGRRQIGR